LRVARSSAELKNFIASARSEGKSIALIPTMGALHEGHVSLLRLGKQLADYCVVSIFVNPRQFSSAADLAGYPRTENLDEQLLRSAGADLLFLPTERDVYPIDGPEVPTISAGDLGNRIEGASRPGHFDGVLTVVSRLFDLACPDIAIFGEKDAQQLFLIRRMVEEQNKEQLRTNPIRVVAASTVREPSGLAMSSRNQRLSASQRYEAAAIHRALGQAAARLGRGEPAPEAIRIAKQQLPKAVRIDYIELVSAASFTPLADGFSGEAILLFAGVLGDIRLIDNEPVRLPRQRAETGQTRATNQQAKGSA